MKSVELENLEKLPGRKLGPRDTFSFRCHPEVSCFNKCCRNLNLFLYPYDVLRLREVLGMSSGEFIDTHVDVVLRPESFFPEVLLRMADNKEKTCPFLTEAGCTVYQGRPDACRTFPVEQGVAFDENGKKPRMIHFFKPPDFCMGQHEEQVWSTETWAKDQEAVQYNKMTTLWAELKGMFRVDPWAGEGPDGRRAKMAFMATYNVDSFREFVFESSFLKRYKVKADVLKKIRKDDTELMKFGFIWIKAYLFGVKSKTFRLR